MDRNCRMRLETFSFSFWVQVSDLKVTVARPLFVTFRNFADVTVMYSYVTVLSLAGGICRCITVTYHYTSTS